MNKMHYVLNTPISEPFSKTSSKVLFGMGCFWGAERLFWQLPGVISTAVGYAGGETLNPNYEQVCGGQTLHAEVVLVVYEPEQISLSDLLIIFWQEHDPTQGMRQGNDRGSQYRSVIYTFNDKDYMQVLQSKDAYQKQLVKYNLSTITTEIKKDQVLYYAEDYHQQYLAKNPAGYCGLKGTGIILNE